MDAHRDLNIDEDIFVKSISNINKAKILSVAEISTSSLVEEKQEGSAIHQE